LLKAHDLVASPAYIVIKAEEEFQDKTTAPNQLWQTDFTYLKITGWGWSYLSTVLDDFSRFIVAWKLCATMKAQAVTATLALALAASGLDQMTVVHRPRLLSDNGASYVAEDLAAWLNRQKIEHVRSAPYALPIPSLLGGDADVQPSAATAGWGHPQVRRQFQEPAFGRRRLWRRLAAARSRGWSLSSERLPTTSRKRLSFGTGSCSSNGSRRTCSRSVYSTASYTSSTNRGSIGIGTAARPDSIGANTRSASPSKAKKKGRVLRDPP
jgi:Integrase core domain